MDFNLSPNQEKLQDEFRLFFEKEMKKAPPGWHGGNVTEPYLNDENWAFHVNMARKLGEKGWLMLSLSENGRKVKRSAKTDQILGKGVSEGRSPNGCCQGAGGG